ncbi:ATP-dependent dethiobiotin synthetase BioD [Phyllobacterium endophyticum]|uniref:ATP-dependent dethiobiotin synthetase BioD n=1 Tax=Phyllobacterium endophyticum TaxID=1149773 RepID=UPI0016508EF6|nr:AAA family ATPase [Phyllobacterium endophyticum]
MRHHDTPFCRDRSDTNIGKTVFSAALADALGACYWKPVQSGLDGETDSKTVGRLGRIPPMRIYREAWRLKTPASPHVAARIAGVQIRPEALSPPLSPCPLIIEGAVFGVAFIGNEQTDTLEIIPKLGNVTCLGRLPRIDPLTTDTLREAFRVHFDLSCFQKAAA